MAHISKVCPRHVNVVIHDDEIFSSHKEKVM